MSIRLSIAYRCLLRKLVRVANDDEHYVLSLAGLLTEFLIGEAGAVSAPFPFFGARARLRLRALGLGLAVKPPFLAACAEDRDTTFFPTSKLF